MVKVVLTMPRDLTFLSNVLHEGLLFATQFSLARFNDHAVELPDDFLVTAVRNLEDEKINSLKIVMARNDNVNKKLFVAYGINDQSRKTYYDLLSKIKSHADSFAVRKESVNLGVEFRRRNMVIDGEDLAAPQLLKVDRYTGISSMESGYMSQQLTIYTSKEIMMIFFLGLYSSFIASVRHQGQQYYFFLTFSPEEIETMLNNIEDMEFIRRLFRTKDGIIRILNDVLSKTSFTEPILLEVYLNTEIKRMMERENLDKISVILFKIAPEGQTYKVYEQVPMTIYKEGQKFYEVVRRHFEDPERFLENLSEVLKPNGVIFDALRNMDRYDEANNILKAVYGLYRFVILDSVEGWYEFLREISNAYGKLESAKSGERRRVIRYKNILRMFA